MLGGEQSSTLSLLSAQVKPDYQKSGERNNDHCIPGSSSRLCSVNAQAFECFQFYYYCKARGGSGPSQREQFLFTASWGTTGWGLRMANNDTKWRGQLSSYLNCNDDKRKRGRQMWIILKSITYCFYHVYMYPMCSYFFQFHGISMHRMIYLQIHNKIHMIETRTNQFRITWLSSARRLELLWRFCWDM